METTYLSNLKIHELTEEQYNREKNAGRLDPNAIYLTPDLLPPAMHLGVEYRTTERWNGKAVYTKLVDCGLSTHKKYIGHNISGSVIRFSGSFMNGSYFSPLPYIISENLFDEDNIYLYVGGTSIVIMCGTGKTERQVYCQLWYTKE